MFTEKIITKFGYLETTLPFVHFNELLENINSYNFDEEANYRLAGQIETEKSFNLNFVPNSIKEIIIEGCNQYLKTFGHNKLRYVENNNYRINFDSSWINFQKKFEYNPIHNHFGDLVYVIWIKIPYDLTDELNHKSAVNSNHRIASKFQFVNTTNHFSNVSNDIIDVDKTYEGRMIIFHSKMEHTVYPFFTSDDYRISMSGNLNIII